MTDQHPDTDTGGLVDLIDRLERLLEDSELSELEVEAGTTGFVLRKPSAFAAQVAVPTAPAAYARGAAVAAPSLADPVTPPAADAPPVNAVVAPLTGLFYSSPSPG